MQMVPWFGKRHGLRFFGLLSIFFEFFKLVLGLGINFSKNCLIGANVELDYLCLDEDFLHCQ